MNDETRKRWVFFGIMLSIFLAAIESTVVATAMPTVVTHLGGIRIYSWVFSGFLLTQTVTMPLWGRFSDLYGRRPVYLAGLTIFLAGVALFAAGVSALLLGIVEAGRAGSWSRIDVVALLVLGAIGLVAFVAIEQRAADPIVPLRLFKSRMIVAAVVTRFLVGTAMFGALSFVPLFLQSVTGATATGAGLVLTPFVLGWVVTSVLSARLVLRISYRSVVLAGMACLTG